MGNLFKSKKLFYFVLLPIIIVGLLAVSFFGYKYWQSTKDPLNKVLATVGKKKITQKNFNERAFVSTGLGTPIEPIGVDEYIREPILNELIKLEVLKNQAKEKKVVIKVSKDEISSYVGKNFEGYSSADKSKQEAYKKAAYASLFEEKLKDNLLTYREGKALLCRYDRYLQDDVKEEGKAALKTKKETYAKTYCEGIKSRLKDKKSSYEVEKKKLLEDAEIGNKSWEPWLMNLAVEFKKDDFSEDKFDIGSNLRDKIITSKDAINGPLSINVIEDHESNKKTDGMYAVILIDDKGKDGGTIDFDGWMEKTIEEMKKKGDIKIL